MALTPPPTAPLRTDPQGTFDNNIAARIAWDSTNVTELGALQTDVAAKQTIASAAAVAAAASAAMNSASMFSFPVTFSTNTAMADPGAGTVRFNNATLASVTAMAFDSTDADAGNPDVSGYIATWGASTSTIKGYLTFRKVGAPATYAIYTIGAAVTNNSGWLQVTVAYVAGNGALSNADSLTVQFSRTGDAGTTNTATDTHAAASKATPVDADELTLVDSAAAWVLKKLTWANLYGTLATLTQTLTNKRVTPRILSAASYTTDTGTSLNCDNLDRFIVTAQAGALKFNNPTGTPTEGQRLVIAVTGTAARVLTYDTQFEGSTVALPGTTVTTARLDMEFTWRADTSKWRIINATVAASSGAMVLLSTVTASNSATCDVETTFNATYDQYLIVLSGVVLQTSEWLGVRMKIGGSYLSAVGTSYTGNFVEILGTMGTTAGRSTDGSGGGATEISIGYLNSWWNDASAGINGEVLVFNPASTTLVKRIKFNLAGNHTNNYTLMSTIGAATSYSTAALTGVRFFAATGNIVSGTFRLYGLTNS